LEKHATVQHVACGRPPCNVTGRFPGQVAEVAAEVLEEEKGAPGDIDQYLRLGFASL
jgi:hypothetical protein